MQKCLFNQGSSAEATAPEPREASSEHENLASLIEMCNNKVIDTDFWNDIHLGDSIADALAKSKAESKGEGFYKLPIGDGFFANRYSMTRTELSTYLKPYHTVQKIHMVILSGRH